MLLAVQTGNKLSDDDRMSMKEDDFSVLSPEAMAEKFSFVPEAIARTGGDRRALQRGTRAQAKVLSLPEFPKPDGKTANAYLRELAMERLPKKVSRRRLQTQEVMERLEYEMASSKRPDSPIISSSCRTSSTGRKRTASRSVPAAARPREAWFRTSSASPTSIPSPTTCSLNGSSTRNASQMPDIDIDFSDVRRDEVLAYAREKYGEDRVARIITFGTMAARAAIRDAGRAMGYSYAFCDQIAKLIPFNPTQGMKEGWLDECLKNVVELKALYDANADAKKLIDTARHLEGVARHASVHACGTVIAKDRLIERVPLQFAPQEKEIIITQFEMHAVEDLGLLKIDFLGLRNLTIIEEAVRLIRELHDVTIDIDTIPLDDKKTFELLQRGDTTGVFQFESSGMRRYMKDLKPTVLEDIIAMVALYRPGPLEAGEVPRFINRKHGKERITYLHPKLEPILKNTYGVGVYQEQMMQIARDLGGYTLPEADTLRKAIGKKIKSLLDEQEAKLMSGMVKNGIPERTAKQIWEMFPSFARYGFNKSHAACYALIGYQTAYLKAHYPEEFMAALLNSELDDIERISFLIQEAKQSGIDILPPDVNKSFVTFTPEGDKITIRASGHQERRLRDHESDHRGTRARRTVQELSRSFLTRIQHKDLNKKSLESLTKSGAFDSLGIERNQALANMDDILKFANAMKKGGGSQTGSLFGETLRRRDPETKTRDARDERRKAPWEKELIGFYLSDHPLKAHAPTDRVLQSETDRGTRAAMKDRTPPWCAPPASSRKCGRSSRRTASR